MKKKKKNTNCARASNVTLLQCCRISNRTSSLKFNNKLLVAAEDSLMKSTVPLSCTNTLSQSGRSLSVERFRLRATFPDNNTMDTRPLSSWELVGIVDADWCELLSISLSGRRFCWVGIETAYSVIGETNTRMHCTCRCRQFVQAHIHKRITQYVYYKQVVRVDEQVF